MGNQHRRYVMPNERGGWDVKSARGHRASAHTDTQRQAQDRTREIVHNAGGGEVVTGVLDGQIRDPDTIAPGNGPNAPRDTK